MKILFLSHKIHPVHLNFAREVGADIKELKLNYFVKLMKKQKSLKYIYPILSFLYSLLINIKKYDFLFVEGGSSLYVAGFLKFRKNNLKIIFLDCDNLFFNLNKTNGNFLSYFVNKIDGVVSVSEENKKYVEGFLKVPVVVCPPYPKNVKKIKIKRKNYGLYVGRLDPDKNIERIIDFALQCPYIDRFLVVGKGTLQNQVKKKAKKYRKIIYLGKKENMSKYYSQCKFLIHLPDHDPHPCTTMEAALCGCFPIISKGVGSKYLFDQFFIVKNKNNFKEINRKIEYILKNKKKMDIQLKKNIKKIPTKKESLIKFKQEFGKIVNGIA